MPDKAASGSRIRNGGNAQRNRLDECQWYRKVQRYLRQRFSNHKLTLARRENKDDSADLMLEDEFIGVVFRDDEDGDTCYHVQITVLAEDLDD